MARTKGTANLSASLEPLAGAPLDARDKVPAKADLTASGNFPYHYVGMETYVVAENKKYRLIGNDPTVLANWQEVGTGGGSITIDPTPTENSQNAVQSGGTYTALANKVDKVNGKGLSTEDYTSVEKTKLAGVETGAEVNAIDGITVNGDVVTPDANRVVALSVLTNTVDNLLNYYKKTETYTKTEVDTIVSAISGATFESVQTLPTTGIKTNVIYLVPSASAQTSNIKDEYINLDGTTAGWELIGNTQIDLSSYVTTSDLNTALADYTTTANLTTLLNGKVDKVSGKQLSTEDYTTAEKTKLSGLSNYDDTALSGRVSDIEDVVPSTATTSNKLATMADVVSGAGGHIIEDSTGVDMTTRTNLQFVGASVTDDSTNDRTVVTVNTSDKADKVASATNGNLASLDNNGNLADSGVASSNVVTTSSTAGLLKNDGTVDTTQYVSDVSGKADKVASSVSGDLAGLDANGNITDSGIASNIFPSTATSSNKLATMADIVSGNGHTIEDSTGTDMTARTNLQFVGATVTDDSTNDRTVVTIEGGGGGITSNNVKSVEVEFDSTTFEPTHLYFIIDDKFEIPEFNTQNINGILKAIDGYYSGDFSLTDLTDVWDVGDSIQISLPEIVPTVSGIETQPSQTLTMAIMDFNRDVLTTPIGNKTNALLTLGATNDFQVTGKLTSGIGDDYDGWDRTIRRTWLNSDLYNSLPSNIASKTKVVTRTYPSAKRGNITLTDEKAFILKSDEYLGSSRYAFFTSMQTASDWQAFLPTSIWCSNGAYGGGGQAYWTYMSRSGTTGSGWGNGNNGIRLYICL